MLLPVRARAAFANVKSLCANGATRARSGFRAVAVRELSHLCVHSRHAIGAVRAWTRARIGAPLSTC